MSSDPGTLIALAGGASAALSVGCSFVARRHHRKATGLSPAELATPLRQARDEVPMPVDPAMDAIFAQLADIDWQRPTD